ncbi:MAG TPA: hypothetical protein VJJ23_01305 [Candidatus Nanoarchaeia archaeon]|nr:hypothetical protein [Candidatus Nanoarchaeia archaeon]
MTIEAIYHNAESLNEIAGKYDILLEKRRLLTEDVAREKDKIILKKKKDELISIESQISQLKNYVINILANIEKLSQEELRNANQS